jgi:hypothetical protein
MSSVLERIEVAVTFDERRGYVASHPELPGHHRAEPAGAAPPAA